MNYPNGEKIKVGDTLKLWEDCIGEVVCAIEDNEFTDKFTREDWNYLDGGILISTNAAGLIHYTEPEKTFSLIRRA
jgi:hypothetical protein